MDWANFGPKKLISPSGLGPAQKAGLGQDPPGPATKTGGGNYFPPTPACRTLFVLHAEKEKKSKNARMREKKGYLARRGRCVTGLPTSLAVLRWRPVAVSSGAVVPTTAPSGATVSHGAVTFFPVPCCSFVFSRSLAVSSFPSSQCWVFGVSLLCFGWFSLLFSLFGFFFFGLSPSFFSVFSFFSSLPFPPPRPVLFSAFLGSIYRAKGVAFSHGEQLAGRPLGATAKVRLHPVFWQVRGRLVCSVGGLQAREGPEKIQTKAPFSLLPRCNVWGGRRKRNSVVQNDTVLLLFFFFLFFFECMKRRRFGENAPFHLNVAPECAKFQISP